MADVLIGVLTIAVGALLCFRGYAALRFVIAAWGAYAGFWLGAGLVAATTDEALLASAAGWAVGLLAGVVIGLIAYVWYAVSVVIGMGAMGFTLGTTAMAALGVSWSWLVVLVGLAAGVLLAVLAVAGDLPLVVLALVGAFAGASTILVGVLLLAGSLDVVDLGTTGTTGSLALGPWWTASYLVLAVAGVVVQMRSIDDQRRTLRTAWSA